LLEIFEKALHDWLTLEPKSKEEARNMRQGFKEILRRSKELETEALHHWEKVLRMINKNMQKQIFTSKGNISLRRVQADEGDMEILLKWLTNPEIVHWVYEEGIPWNMQKITEKFGKKAKAEDGLVTCFILQNDEEIGYLQMYPIEEDSFKFNDPEGFQLITDGFGIDMFIGETNLWGRGIGAQVVGVVEEYLFDKCKAKVIYVDPSIHNTRAVHFWQKVGFIPMDLIEDYDDCRKKSVLMRKLLKEK